MVSKLEMKPLAFVGLSRKQCKLGRAVTPTGTAERKLADSKPDNPPFDLTGRYQATLVGSNPGEPPSADGKAGSEHAGASRPDSPAGQIEAAHASSKVHGPGSYRARIER